MMVLHLLIRRRPIPPAKGGRNVSNRCESIPEFVVLGRQLALALAVSVSVAGCGGGGDSGDGSASNPGPGQSDTTHPSVPVGLVATAVGASVVNLTWSASTDNVAVIGYIVRRDGVEVGTSVTPDYADTGLSSATSYTYTVTARDAAGNESPVSSSVSATTADTIAPSTPTGVVATVAGTTSINLTWSASTDNVAVTGYSVKRNGVEVGTPATPSFTDTGLSVATPYTYTVTARDLAGNVSGSSTSASATILDTSAPSTPTGLVATVAGATTINLTWSASTDNVAVTGYSVKRNGVEVGTPATPSFTDTGLSVATPYTYTVTARDLAGNVSGSSTSASATILDTSAPSTPTGVVATVAGTTSINLTWSASTDNVAVTGYSVKRNGVEVGTPATPSFTDTGLSVATPYTYTVTARDLAGNVSGSSTSASATILDTSAPSTPTGLVATVAGATTINLTWSASTDNVAVTGYSVKRNGVEVGTPATPSFTDTGLSVATPYTYTVTARDLAGNVSGSSTSASATILDTSAPSTPTGVVATVAGTTSINLTWSASTDNVAVTGYSVKRNGVEVGTPATPSFTDTGLSVATPYTYTVTARDLAGNVSGSSTSASATILDTSAPSTPTGLVATVAGATTINLTWSASTDNVAVTGYSVKRNGVEVGTPATPSFTDTGLSVATPYTYTVTARDLAGNVSGSSTSASATILDTSAPSTPTGVVATVAGTTSINLTWSASTDNVAVTGYSVKRNGVEVGTPATPSFTDTGLSVATPYTYTVTARDLAGNVSGSSTSASATILDTSAPSTPTGLVATVAGATTINLTWSASTDNVAVTGYSVKRNGVEVGTPATPSFTDTGLSVATPYTYTVTARDLAGNVSGSSTSASATILDTSAPSTPTGLVATVAGATTINLAWSASTDNVAVTGYIVRRNGIQVGTPTTPAYSDTGLSSGTTYNYTVAARDAANNISPDSAIASAATADVTPPSIPASLVAIAAGATTINLTWSASTDNVAMTGYIVRRNGIQVGTPTTPAYSDTGLSSSTTYNYTVAARDAANNISPDSAIASATTADVTPPSIPASLVAIAAGATTINLTWSASTDNVGVTGYIVRRNGIQVGTPTTPTYSDTGLSSGTTYNYTVAARDAANNVSYESAVASATTADTIAPSIPASLVASAAGATTINLTWNASTDNVAVTGYIVKRNGTQVGTSVTPSFADTGLLSGLTYSYTVTARDAANNVSSDSASASATTADSTPPSTPASLVATVAAGVATINLTWSASTDNVGVTGYIVKRNGTQVGTSVAPSYADTGLASATTYTYTIAARDAANNVSSESAIASATTADITPPTTPAGLVATAAGSAAINLTWSASTDNVAVTGYIVKRNGVQVGTSASPAYADTGLSAATTYGYTVQARDVANNISPDSTSASATTTSAADTIAPSIPTGLVATVTGPTTINLSWAASTDNVGVTSYVVSRNGTQVGTTSTPGFTDAGLTAGTNYVYTVAARDAAGNTSASSGSASATIPDTSAPSTPAGLVATAAGATTINLTWSASTDNVGVTAYVIRRNGTQVGSSATPSFADTGLLSGLTYSYTVAARDAAGNISSASASVDATTADTISPSVPIGLVATPTGATVVNLSWTASTDNVGVTGYIVKRNGTQVGTSVAPSFADSGLSSATTYTYTIAARDAANNVSPESAIVSATTADTIAPTTPTGMVATEAGATAINLSWTASTDNVGVTGYIVKRDGVQVATPTTTSYADTGLSSATMYSYTVAARDAAGNISANSSSASATTIDTIAPSTPTGLVATAAVGVATINLTWSASSDNVGVTGYIVKRNGVQVGTSNTTNYTDSSGLNSATVYSYTVAARDGAVNISPDSVSVSVMTADTTPPSTPAGLVATAAAGTATINLSWTASTDNVGVTGYVVRRNGVQIGTPGSTNYADAGLAAATTYIYTVAARDAAGNVSSESASVSATTAVVLFPVSISPNQRYLQDQNGGPFPILGRTAWFLTSLPVADYKTFIDDSVAKGYNAIEFHFINHDPRGNNEPRNGNGDLPFLKRLDGNNWSGVIYPNYSNINSDAPNFTTPNEAYWSFVDALLAYAESKGVLCFMFPAYVGYAGTDQGWMNEMVANGATRMQSYGAWIATRYQNQKNLVWMAGGDMSVFDAGQTAVESALISGLKSVANQQSKYYSAEWERGSIATDQPSFGSQMTLNGTYANSIDINNQGRRAYARSPTMPAFLLEEPYDQEGADGNGLNLDATQPVRRFQWWGMLSNIGGYISGNGYVWQFNAGWQSHLNTQGAQDMARLNAFVRSIAWYNLVPSGLGGMRTLVTAGGGALTSSNYVAAAATPDGTLLVAYVPPDHVGPITIDLTAMSGPTRARWLDPTTAAFSDAAVGLLPPGTSSYVFTPPFASHGDSYTDWVLLLQKQ